MLHRVALRDPTYARIVTVCCCISEGYLDRFKFPDAAGIVCRTAGTLCRTAHARRNSDIICVQMQFYKNLSNGILYTYMTIILSEPCRWSLPTAVRMGHNIMSPWNFTKPNSWKAACRPAISPPQKKTVIYGTLSTITVFTTALFETHQSEINSHLHPTSLSFIYA